jgi:hypothetical protein
LGYLSYALAGAIAIAGIVFISRDDATPKVAAGTIPIDTTTVPPTTTTVPGAVEKNTTPVITAPLTIDVARSGSSPLKGISVEDVEARRDGKLLLVLLTAPKGEVTLGRVAGLKLYKGGTSGSAVAFSGTIQAVNIALAGLTYKAGSSDERAQVRIVVSKNALEAQKRQVTAKAAVTLRVSG